MVYLNKSPSLLPESGTQLCPAVTIVAPMVPIQTTAALPWPQVCPGLLALGSGLGGLAAVGAVCLPSQLTLLPSRAAGEGGREGLCPGPEGGSGLGCHSSGVYPLHITHLARPREGRGVSPFLLSFSLHLSIWPLMG